MRDRRNTFTKEYINNIVNPLGTRPLRITSDLNHNNSSSGGSVGGGISRGGGTAEDRTILSLHINPSVAATATATTSVATTASTSTSTGAEGGQQYYLTAQQFHPSQQQPSNPTVGNGMLMPVGGGGIAATTETADTLALSGLGVSVLPTTTVSAAAVTAHNKDTTWTKLFVGGLPYHTTDQSLREHFSIYGDIEEAVVITDRQTGKSRGYGFVIMGDKSSSDRACKDANPIIDGRKANVNLAILGAKPRGNVQPGYPFAGLRAGYPTLLPSQYGMPPSYVYQSPYLTAATPGSLVPLPATQLSHAAAVAAASQFYEYQSAVAAATAPYTGQYTATTNGFDGYSPYSGAAGYFPYTYAATLPQASAIPAAAATTATFPAIPYQTAAQAQTLQEARLQ